MEALPAEPVPELPVPEDEPKPKHTKKRRQKKNPLDRHNNKYAIPGAPNPPDVLTTPSSDPWPRPYLIDGGLRRVAPYHFTYNTWCKQRWRGRSLIEIFEDEFRDRPLAYYRSAMERGLVSVNAKAVGPEYVMVNGDLISHTLHRHEPAVTADPVVVLHETDEMIVINKPAGVPVHPTGRYNFNSVTEIMKSERGPEWMAYPCNRLDRLTSGVMFVGKTAEGAEKLARQIEARTVRKEYVARVIGRFPDGEVVCNQPILAISPKLGLNRVRANGKFAKTVFKRLAHYPSRDGQKKLPGFEDKDGYSIVRCLPVTGRTHQIRVHLQYLGYPIQNDPIYANRKVWGFDLGCKDPDGQLNTDEDVISRLSRMGKEDVAEAVAYYDEMVDDYEKKRAEKMTGEVCQVCQTPLYSDPGLHELSLWLHSLRYEDANGAWGYQSPLPKWALPPEGLSGPTEVGDLSELTRAVPLDGEDEAQVQDAQDKATPVVHGDPVGRHGSTEQPTKQ